MYVSMYILIEEYLTHKELTQKRSAHMNISHLIFFYNKPISHLVINSPNARKISEMNVLNKKKIIFPSLLHSHSGFNLLNLTETKLIKKKKSNKK